MSHTDQGQDIQNKIEREKKIIQGASQLKKRTNNNMVIQKCNTSIREAQQNIDYLEDSLRRLSLHLLKTGEQKIDQSGQSSGKQSWNMGGNNKTPVQDAFGSENGKTSTKPTYNPRLSTISPREIVFSRLDLLNYDCPSLAQRIPIMLQQLEFKLQVEKQYYAANEKMTKLYQIDGDQRTSYAAENGVKESKNRINLLTRALKKYQAINVDFDKTPVSSSSSLSSFSSSASASLATATGEDSAIEVSNDPKFNRKQLTGVFNFSISAIRDVDHISSPIFSRKPETIITVKIDDTERVRSKPSRTDRWNEEYSISVDKGNEVEITIYDKINDQVTPVAIMWLLLSDIAEEIRKKKAGKNGQQGWVMAQDVINNKITTANISATGVQNPTLQSNILSSPHAGSDLANATEENNVTSSAWFVLEPAGQLLLNFGFTKQQSSKKKFIGGLNRHGAIIKRHEEVFEQHGHHFVQKSFYNIMCCAYCGDFLRYSGFQCQDCKFLCHKKCYQHVVTKCIAKSSAETNQDEAQLNHRIPHRFQPASNRGTKWCCHCGYILPWGRKNVRKCSECGVMCHAHCSHLVPDFCGMSMETANQILTTIKNTKVSSDKLSIVSPSGHVSPGKTQSRNVPSGVLNSNAETYSPLSNIRAPSIRRPPPSMPPIETRISTLDPNAGNKKELPTTPYENLFPSRINPQVEQYEQQQQEKVQAFVNRRSNYDMFAQSATDESTPVAQDYEEERFDQQPNYDDIERNMGESGIDSNEYTQTEGSPYESYDNNSNNNIKNEYNYADDQYQSQEYDQSMVSEQYLHPSGQIELDTAPDHYSPQKMYATGEHEQSRPPTQRVSSANNPFREMTSAEFANQTTQSVDMDTGMEPQHTPSFDDNGIDTAYQSKPYVTNEQSSYLDRAQSIEPETSPRKSKRKPAKRKKVSLDDFVLIKVLGKGNFGKVLLARSKHTENLCAIKVLKKEHIIKNHDIESARAEKKVFLLATKAKHPFLTNLYCSFQTENRIYFAMEFIGGGDLMWHVQNQRLSVRRAKFYAAEVLLALKYFHDNGVIYRDLKLENIMLTTEGHIKIADYGLCKDEMWYGCKTSTFCGTPEFMAPEILKEQEYTKAVDWWAFGVLLYQMLLCQSPFSGDDEDEVFNAILGDEPLYPIDMAGDIVQIFQGLLTKDPEKRLGAGPNDALEIMREPFFRNINFDDILNQRVKPPFVPEMKGPEDTSYFEQEFTSAPPTLTPLASVLNSKMQEQFRGFSSMPDEMEI